MTNEEIAKCGCGGRTCESYYFRWLSPPGRFTPDQIPGMLRSLVALAKEHEDSVKMAEQWLAGKAADEKA
jgi:hypothetical protein